MATDTGDGGERIDHRRMKKKWKFQDVLERLGLVSYILAFSAGLWAWPATFLAAWYIQSTAFRAVLVAYLIYIWIWPGKLQPGRAEGPTFLKRCVLPRNLVTSRYRKGSISEDLERIEGPGFRARACYGSVNLVASMKFWL